MFRPGFKNHRFTNSCSASYCRTFSSRTFSGSIGIVVIADCDRRKLRESPLFRRIPWLLLVRIRCREHRGLPSCADSFHLIASRAATIGYRSRRQSPRASGYCPDNRLSRRQGSYSQRHAPSFTLRETVGSSTLQPIKNRGRPTRARDRHRQARK